jgi:hypothetical protein
LWLLAAASAISALMMEAANSSKTSVNFYQSTERNNPEDSHVYTSRYESLKSQPVFL